MSDGITDSYRDQRRADRYGDFLKAVARFIENQTPDNLKLLTGAAEAVDDVPRGLMSGTTNLAKGLQSLIDGLVGNDPKVWGNLLLTAAEDPRDKTYKKLKALSPFAGKILIQVDYGIGFVTLRGEIQSVLDQIICNGSNLKVYDADDYLVAIPEFAFVNAQVTWLRCGYYQIKEPRKARGK